MRLQQRLRYAGWGDTRGLHHNRWKLAAWLKRSALSCPQLGTAHALRCETTARQAVVDAEFLAVPRHKPACTCTTPPRARATLLRRVCVGVTGLEGRLAHTRERVRSHIEAQQLASVAQLGERSTEDAEVRISIILGGIRISFCVSLPILAGLIILLAAALESSTFFAMVVRAIVVGAGVAGLSAALALFRRGCRVAVLDQRSGPSDERCERQCQYVATTACLGHYAHTAALSASQVPC